MILTIVLIMLGVYLLPMLKRSPRPVRHVPIDLVRIVEHGSTYSIEDIKTGCHLGDYNSYQDADRAKRETYKV